MDPVNDILRKVRRTLLEHRMTRPGDRVLAGVSGGPDSVCLLHVLNRLRASLKIDVTAAHFDHGLRPGQDDNESRFVRAFADTLGIPLEIGNAEGAIGPETPSLEERARQARYRFLTRTAEKHGARRIALGHHLDDQAETVLMRLLRGSGPAGLAGIPAIREDAVIRPLIRIPREEILEYLEKSGLRFMTDPSNRDPRFLRNRIRMELLPLLQTYQPQIVERLTQTACILRDDEAFLSEMAGKWLKRAATRNGPAEIRIPAGSLIRLPRALKNRVIRCAVRETAGSLQRVTLRHIEAVAGLAAGRKSQAVTTLPNHLTVRKIYDDLVFSTARPRTPPGFCFFLDKPGAFYLEALGCRVSLEEIPGNMDPGAEASPWRALLDREKIGYPLMIRNFRKLKAARSHNRQDHLF